MLRFVKHPITNGVAEALNSKIMSIKQKAGGFRNPSNFTTAIYFHCGGLDLYPRKFRMVQINKLLDNKLLGDAALERAQF